MTYRFVTFHIALPTRSQTEIGSDERLLQKGFVLQHLFSRERRERQNELISMCLVSALERHPGSQIDVITDTLTEFAALPPGVNLWRYELDPTRVMYSRLQGQIRFLKELTGNSSVFLLDSDMLVNGSLSDIGEMNFALALTVREDKEMPVNGGLLIVDGSQRARAIALLERTAEIYATRYGDQSVWWGDQLALRDLVLESGIGNNFHASRNADGILLLPSATYNYTPEYRDMYIQFRRPRVSEKILHFKGRRKSLMRHYWYAFLNPKRSLGFSRLAARCYLNFLAIYQVLRNSVDRIIFPERIASSESIE